MYSGVGISYCTPSVEFSTRDGPIGKAHLRFRLHATGHNSRPQRRTPTNPGCFGIYVSRSLQRALQPPLSSLWCRVGSVGSVALRDTDRRIHDRLGSSHARGCNSGPRHRRPMNPYLSGKSTRRRRRCDGPRSVSPVLPTPRLRAVHNCKHYRRGTVRS